MVHLNGFEFCTDLCLLVVYILYRPRLGFVLSAGSIEKASEGQPHTCCHTVGFSVVKFSSQTPPPPPCSSVSSLLYAPGSGMGTGGGGAEGWSRQNNTSEWASLMSFILGSERRWRWWWGGRQLSVLCAKLPGLCRGHGPGVSHCSPSRPDAASKWPQTKVGERRPVKLQAMKETNWQRRNASWSVFGRASQHPFFTVTGKKCMISSVSHRISVTVGGGAVRWGV